eukprot:TRINITY_DN5176_c0_g2_i1.p2 TRINITY_DN5176_c0_g2~~TRINITY_DN5176_c0_g2_i1.p2  ORF type:complete len:100 (+),score=12.70 TRINITY_DN5176_c0_g2_i1:201-500(+)
MVPLFAKIKMMQNTEMAIESKFTTIRRTVVGGLRKLRLLSSLPCPPFLHVLVKNGAPLRQNQNDAKYRNGYRKQVHHNKKDRRGCVFGIAFERSSNNSH